jgi:putative ABC transport system permease protein
MIRPWLAGLVRRRGGRLAMATTGIALAVALIAALGAFLTASKATMTARATRSVAVDWQVQVQPGADPAAVLAAVRAAPGTKTALPVGFARATGLAATTSGTTQQTGAAVLLGLPDGYRATFGDQVRQLAGADAGVLVAQQTAANLHVGPGDTVRIALPGRRSADVRIDGVVDLPQANSLFQKVGAPPASQPTAPPDNVLLLPQARFAAITAPLAALDPGAVVTQIHLRRDAGLPPDPAAAFTDVTAAAHNLEARLAGAGVVGDNVGAALDGARKDALYAQILFLFLGVPGAILAALLTSAVAGAGADRRRAEQALLRTRGLRPRQILTLAGIEAAAVGLGGGILGLVVALLAGRAAFGSAAFGSAAFGAATFGGSTASVVAWFAIALLVGLAVAAGTILAPAVADLRSATVASARTRTRVAGTPLWARLGLDVIALAASGFVFWASGSNNYALVLAPEGVATISVSYWAFLGPALFWLGSALLLWRLTSLALAHGRGPLTRLVRPLTGRLASTTAASMTRRRRPLARSVVLLALALSFAASTAVFNATYRQQAEVDALLSNGADVTVTQSPGAVVGPDAARALAAVPGVRAVEPLQHRFAYVGSDLQDLYGVRPGTITGATALQDAYFVGGTARQLMATLAARPDSILVSDETVKDFQLRRGDLINLRLQDGATKAYKKVPFHYAGVAKEFPTAPKDSFFIANADYVARATGSAAVGAFLLDTGGSNQAQVAAAVRARLGAAATVTDIGQSRSQVGSSLTSVDLAGLTRIELAFAVVLAAAAAGIVLALGLAERRRTFAITTVLGGTARQLRGLVLSEAAAVTAAGLLGGAVIAWGLSRMLVTVLTGVFDPPPSTIAVPWGYLALTVAAVLAAISVAARAGARSSATPAVEELREL